MLPLSYCKSAFMYWKSLTVFFSICFIVLVSLEAIADDQASSLHVAEVKVKLEGQTEIAKLQETESGDQICGNENKPSDSLAKVTINTETIKKSTADYPNLSFNFIYYILYKFKYIDSFGLSTPEKSTSPKKENILWH